MDEGSIIEMLIAERSLVSLGGVLNRIPEDDRVLAGKAIAHAHMACLNIGSDNFEEGVAILKELNDGPGLRKAFDVCVDYRLEDTALGIREFLGDMSLAYEADTSPVRPRNRRADIDERFREYCSLHGVDILRVIQKGAEGPEKQCSYIYLVLNDGGLIEVWKELIDRKVGVIGGARSNEDEIYDAIGGLKGALSYRGKKEISEGIFFMRFPYLCGSSLGELMSRGWRPTEEEARFIVNRLAKTLASLHEKGIICLDIKPDNVMICEDGVFLLDFGISMFSREKNIICVAEPAFMTPECGTSFRASFASDVFQLGILFHELIVGRHPFIGPTSCSSREESLIRYSLANIFLPPEISDGPDSDTILRMLDKSPALRPTMREVAERTSSVKHVSIVAPRRKHNAISGNTVLFPARMGIPHSGHIDYIGRLIDLGYHVIISLQRSFTITDRDPLPKWVIMKMVAMSLKDRGYDEEDFEFVFTPFYKDDEAMRRHFAMMPGMEDVVAVASSNPAVASLFVGYRILDQKSLFGKEGEEYETLSHGEILRRSVKEGDRKTFDLYAASGVEKILSFDEMRREYGRPNIEFVSGGVDLVLMNDGEVAVSGRALRYLSPEESLISRAAGKGISITMIDRYSRDTAILLEGSARKIRYVGTSFSEGNEKVVFDIV